MSSGKKKGGGGATNNLSHVTLEGLCITVLRRGRWFLGFAVPVALTAVGALASGTQFSNPWVLGLTALAFALALAGISNMLVKAALTILIVMKKDLIEKLS